MIFVREIEMADVKKKGNIAAEVTKLLEGKINEMGYMLWDVEYVKEGSEYYLRITIDNEEGITIDDCEAVHRAIDPMLDDADPIADAYHLEVSSPGVERDLRVPMHFIAMLGWDVEVKLYTAIDGRKKFEGVLTEYDEENDTFTVQIGDKEDECVTLKRGDAAKVMTVYDFGDE